KLPMSDTTSVSPLRQRMTEDMAARGLNRHTQRSHVQSCKRIAAWLKPPSRLRAFSRPGASPRAYRHRPLWPLAYDRFKSRAPRIWHPRALVPRAAPSAGASPLLRRPQPQIWAQDLRGNPATRLSRSTAFFAAVVWE